MDCSVLAQHGRVLHSRSTHEVAPYNRFGLWVTSWVGMGAWKEGLRKRKETTVKKYGIFYLNLSLIHWKLSAFMIKDSRKKFPLQVHQCGQQAVMSSVVTMQVSWLSRFISHKRNLAATHEQAGTLKREEDMRTQHFLIVKFLFYQHPGNTLFHLQFFFFSYTMLKGSVFTHM